VDELPAGHSLASGAGAAFELAATVSGDAMAGSSAADPGELLDVDVDQLAGSLALVAVGRLGRLQATALAQPDLLQPT
jgi:hypothetical protein